MKLVRMKPGHGDVLLAEGDPEVAEDEERLVEEFRRQLDLGMWAAVPTAEGARREATMVRDFSEIPQGRRAGDLLPAGRRRLTLVLASSAIVLAVLAVVGFGPALAARSRRLAGAGAEPAPPAYDPGRERRAEARARELLRSVVSDDEYAMYARARASSRSTGSERRAATATCSIRTARSSPTTPRAASCSTSTASRFPDRSEPAAGERLPDADDVLAKWMALRGGRARADRGRRTCTSPGASSTPARCGATCAGCATGERATASSAPRASDASRARARAPSSTAPTAPHARAYMKGIGFDDDALSRPTIGIANTWIEAMPCNFHLRGLAEHVKEGVRAAGGTPMEFNTSRSPTGSRWAPRG